MLFRLVAGQRDDGACAVHGAHLLNTFILLKALTLTAWWLSGGTRTSSRSVRRTAAVCIVTGSRCAADGRQRRGRRARRHAVPIGPRCAEGLRADLTSTSHFLIRLRVWHPAIAVTVGALLLLAGPRLPEAGDELGLRIGRALVLAVGAQLLAGLANILLLAPVWMQMVHLLLADLVWIAFVLLSAQCLRVDSPMSEHALRMALLAALGALGLYFAAGSLRACARPGRAGRVRPTVQELVTEASSPCSSIRSASDRLPRRPQSSGRGAWCPTS